MTSKLVVDADERMKKALEAVRREFAGIRSGKATPALLDTVRVEAYGRWCGCRSPRSPRSGAATWSS